MKERMAWFFKVKIPVKNIENIQLWENGGQWEGLICLFGTEKDKEWKRRHLTVLFDSYKLKSTIDW